MASLRCDRCGATQTNDGAFCSYCGSRIIRPDQLKTELANATDPARFDLVRASPNYEIAIAHQPKPAVAAFIVAPAIMLVFVVLFVVFSGALFAGDSHVPVGFKVAFFAVPIVMAILALKMIANGMRYRKAPIEKAILVGRIAPTDVGVAFIKGKRLVDFLRIDPK